MSTIFLTKLKVTVGKKRSKILHGQSQKRGCKFRFIVQQCYCAPDLARIFCSTSKCKHANHGAASEADRVDLDAKLTQPSRLNKELLEWIEKRLAAGITPKMILQEHKGNLKNRQKCDPDTSLPLDRDSRLNMQDIRNCKMRLLVGF